ncbi:MAG TPA: hypothetical protein VLA04_05080 [Verrucomicrobiae bacterium]|nr:hypothetical protein [Verrucomicrobiae bacterium]
MSSLEERISAIEQRNSRVELDKRWETSLLRRAAVVFLTYLVMTLFMWSIDVSRPYLQALIPTLGFFLSTLSVSWLRVTWEKHQK